MRRPVQTQRRVHRKDMVAGRRSDSPSHELALQCNLMGAIMRGPCTSPHFLKREGSRPTPKEADFTFPPVSLMDVLVALGVAAKSGRRDTTMKASSFLPVKHKPAAGRGVAIDFPHGNIRHKAPFDHLAFDWARGLARSGRPEARAASSTGVEWI